MGQQTKERKEKEMNDEELLNQINELIRDEIQEDINDYVDSVEETKKAGLGFVSNDDSNLKLIYPMMRLINSSRIIKK